MRPVIALLLHLYPARWRARYGDEFVAVLEERPLGPFDVADVLLGALDARLHLRGLGAASQHGKGFAMSLRIGGYAAIVGGTLWLLTLAGNAINNGAETGSPFLGYAVVGATVMTLIALVGLSAFQARRHPVLTWAAFAIPALGAVIGLLGYASIALTGDSDTVLIGGYSPWMIGSFGLITMVLGSSLFAVATWRARSLSRGASGLLAIGAILVLVALLGVGSGGLSSPVAVVPVIAAIVAFPAGWIALGISALRTTLLAERAPTVNHELLVAAPDPNTTPTSVRFRSVSSNPESARACLAAATPNPTLASLRRAAFASIQLRASKPWTWPAA